MKRIQSITRTLSQIYPVFLLVLAAFPLIVGLVIDSTLVESRSLIILLAWIPIFTIPAVLLNSRLPIYFASILFFLAGLLEIVHWVFIKGPISLTSILVTMNTNLQESVEFVDFKAPYGLLVLIPFFYVFVRAVRRPISNLKSKRQVVVVGIIGLFSLVFIGENAGNGRLVRKGIPHFAKVAFSFKDKIKLYNEARKETKPKQVDANSLIVDESQTFVLILGESCNRNHLSLYGYHRVTSPQLSQRKDLYTFTDVVSPYSNTLHSVLSILSNSNLEHEISMNERVDILDIFHAAGFKTYWLSNQSPIGIWDNMVTVFANQADVNNYVNIASNSSMEATLVPSYDKRYPKTFSRFRGKGQEKIIAEYDNSVLYNDFIVDSLLNMLGASVSADKNHIATAIYLSDHGENVYDEQNRVGHDYSGILPKANVEIPFMVWLSTPFQAKFPTKLSLIQAAQPKPFVSDDLFHTILDLQRISSPYFDKSRSLFSESFHFSRKRILEDGKDYDAK